MSEKFKNVVIASLTILAVLVTGAWQSNYVSAERYTESQVETPLYPGLTWLSLGPSTQNIRTSMNGDYVSVPGVRFEAQEQFMSSIPLPEELGKYYSNAELAKDGWTSYDAFDGLDGSHFVFYNQSGGYLSVEYLKCPTDQEMTCIAVWTSDQAVVQPVAPAITNKPENLDSATASTFNKTSPVDGATGVNASSVTLKWQSYSSAQKYTYCVQTSDCTSGTDWTSTYDTSVTITNLSSNKTYYWQVRALTCGTCSPKTWVYANSGDSWTFQTQTSKVAIVGNAGVAGAVINYVDGSAKTVTASSTGAYSISVPYNWSGTITPTKAGYLFVPTNATFTNLTTSQTIQNFAASVAYTISGNVGIPGATLAYVYGTTKTVVSDTNGNYSIVVPTGWSGTVTPSKTGYSFSPPSITYTNLSANQPSQNYTATYVTFKISGNTGIGGVTLTYTDGTVKTVVSDNSGNYSIVAPLSWSGTVTPSRIGYTFLPVNRTYSNLSTNQTAQDYTATLITYAISGNTGVAGVTIYYSVDGIRRTATADVSGDYSITVPYAWTGTMTPYKNGYTFNPISRTYTNVLSNQSAQNYLAQTCGSCANIDVTIGSGNVGAYTLASSASRREAYDGLNAGPLQVSSTNAMSIVASQRVLYSGVSYSEMMGLPKEQLGKDYVFPYYNNVAMDSQLRVSNVGGADTTINVYLGGSLTPIDSYFLAAGGATRKNYQNQNSGPLRVTSTSSNILTTIRVLYGTYSYSELMGYPASQLGKDYVFPYYNNVAMDSQLRVSNVGGADTTIKVYLGGNPTAIDSYFLAAGAVSRKNYQNQNSGPLRVTSTSSNILTTIRVLYDNNSYSELMGYPAGQLEQEYWYPVYNNSALDSQLRVSNLGTADTTITVFAGSTQINSFTLAAGAAVRNNYGYNTGPLHVLSSSQPILTTVRLLYNGASYYELMGLPGSQLSTQFYFPWYNDYAMDSELRFAVP
jgi:hypothetical protein